MGALKASGCEIDIRRHISCEVCDHSVTGGYDPFLNQVRFLFLIIPIYQLLLKLKRGVFRDVI